MEYLDVLDENGKKTGDVKPRDQVHRDGNWHRTVIVWIMNSGKEVLLQKRSPAREKYPNMWHISVAGHILAGEASMATVIKEVKEELGLDLKAKDIKFLFTTCKSSTPKPNYTENEFSDVFLVEKDVDVGEIIMDTDEVVDAKFFKWEEYKNIVKEKNADFVIPEYASRLIEAIDSMNPTTS